MIKQKKQSFFLRFFPILILISLGYRHYVKHGWDVFTMIPLVLGLFTLFLILFNYPLSQRLLDFIIKIWEPIGKVIVMAILILIYYIVFMPVGLFLKFSKIDNLNRKFKVNRLSYWNDRPKKERDGYIRQF